MNLAEAIHQRWAATAALDDLLPAARVYTGISVDPTVPYAVITQRSDRPIAYHNDGSAVSTAGLRIELFHDNHDAAVQIADQLKATLDRAELSLSGNDKVINVQRSDDARRQDDDGVWQFVIDFDCTVYRA